MLSNNAIIPILKDSTNCKNVIGERKKTHYKIEHIE